MWYPKRSQYKYAKSRYRVRNWGDYETGLQRRGALTVWLSDAALEGWRAPATGRPGVAVHVGHLRKPPKRRVWRKLHLAINADTGEVLASDLTSRRTADCARVPALLDQIDDRVATFMADGAYDTGAVYEAAREKGDGQRVTVLIPPGRGAQPSSGRSPGQRERNRNIRTMRKLGREEWYATSGYSRRSLVENAVFRYKTVFGTAMRSPAAEKPLRGFVFPKWAWVDSSRRPLQRPETTEDRPQADRRSTTDLTLIRRALNRPNAGKMP